MKKTFLKNCAKLCFFLVSVYGAYACIDGFLGYDYNSVFAPEVSVTQKSYTPLFFDKDFLFYGNTYIGEEAKDFSQSDVKSWSEYLGKALTKQQIEHFLYKEKDLAAIQNYSTTNKRVKNFFALLSIARSNEEATNASYNPWDYDSRKVMRTQEASIEKAQTLYQQALEQQDAFFAHRMWYQVMRLKFYSNNRSAVIDFFQQTQAAQPRTELYYRGVHYVAGAYIAQKEYTKSAPLLAQVFNKIPALRQMTTYEYRPLPAEQIASLYQGLSTEEQCALWAMQGYYSGEKEAIEKILALDSASPYVDFLLSRYINRLEAKINIYGTYGETINSYNGYHLYAKRVATKDFPTTWIMEIASHQKVSNPYLWNLAAGYVAMFQNEFDQARSFLSKADKLAYDSAKKTQVRLLGILCGVSALDQITPQAETKLLVDLQWLWDYQAPKGQEAIRVAYVPVFVGKYLSMLYLKQDNPLMAELTYSEKGFYKNKAQSIAMEQFLLKQDKTPWEAFWTKKYAYNLNDIYESRAIYAFYEDNISKAIDQFRKMNTTEPKYLPSNPFNGKIKDCADCEHALPQKVKYTKLSFLEKIKEMEDKINRKEDVYNNALLVGNAFYNASYFGSTRFFYENKIVDEYGYRITANHWDILLSMKQAKKYYLLAREHAETDEQKAKITYMLAKVERNEYYNLVDFCLQDQDRYQKETVGEGLQYRWDAFEELSRYAHTKYYQEVLAECGYFKRYVSESNQ